MRNKLFTLFLILINTGFVSTAHAQEANSWTNLTAGTFKWETGSNWSLGVPPSAGQSPAITNRSVSLPRQNRQKTIEIDSTTASNSPSTMIIDNLTVLAPIGDQNTLLLNNTGSIALHIENHNSLDVLTNGVISINNSTLLVDPAKGGQIYDEGTVILNSGTIQAAIAISGSGQMTMFNGTVATVDVGDGGGYIGVGGGPSPGDTGTLTIAGGDASADYLKLEAGTTWFTGGTLSIFYYTDIDNQGLAGSGTLTVSNGSWQTGYIFLGTSNQGTLTIAGGTNILGQVASNFEADNAPTLAIAVASGSSGAIWMTGGQMTIEPVVTSAYEAIIGYSGAGQITVSNGTLIADSMLLGDAAAHKVIIFSVGTSAGVGTLTMAGGTGSIYSNLVVGSSDCTGTGAVIVNGGGLFVTNAAHNAVLDVESGTVTLSGGTLVVDVLVTNNPCGSFQQTGGTLVVGGVTNIVTVLPFSITSITSDGHSISIAWQTPGGVTNIVQAANGNPDGSYNTNFSDLASFILIGSGEVTNTYIDPGGATNAPSRFYRVRLVP